MTISAVFYSSVHLSGMLRMIQGEKLVLGECHNSLSWFIDGVGHISFVVSWLFISASVEGASGAIGGSL
jgi:hypothetical protein